MPRFRLFAALIAIALFHTSAAAETIVVDVTVGGNVMPWLPGHNPTFDFGVGDGQVPVAIPLSQFQTGPGSAPLTIWSTGGTADNGVEPVMTDADGYAHLLTNDFGGLSGEGFPSRYMAADWDMFLVQLVGVFADDAGVIVGNPFALGTGKRNVVVPSGATVVQLGVNDDIFGANEGFFSVRVSQIGSPTIWSIQNGDWNTPSTWDGGQIPQVSNTAGIRHDVTLAGAPGTRVQLDGIILDPGGNLLVTDQMTLAVQGQSTLGGGSFGTSDDATLHNQGDMTVAATVLMGEGRLLNTNLFVLESGNFQMDAGAVFTNRSGIPPDPSNAWLRFTGDAGVVDVSSTPGVGTSPVIVNEGIVEKTGGGGTSVVAPRFENHRLVSARSGTLRFTGEFLNEGSLEATAGATLGIAGDVVVPQGQTLSGGGTFDVPSITVAGDLSPGDSLGTLWTTGHLVLESTSHSHFEIGGTTAGTQYDVLNVGGDFTPGGDVTVEFVDGFVPAPGNVFSLWQVGGTIDGEISLDDVSFVNAPDLEFSIKQFDHLIQLGISQMIWSTRNGAWSAGTTWTGGQVPSSFDIVGVRHSVTVSAADSLDVEGLLLVSDGSLNAANSQNVTFDFEGDTFQWSGGRLNTGGAGATFTNVGVINIVDGPGDDATLRVGLINEGTVIQTRSEFPLRFVGSGIVQNQSLWDIQGDGGFQHTADGGSGTREFNNLAGGTLRKSAGMGVSAINLALHNDGGTIEVQTGTLSLALGGTSTGGTFLVAPGATLDLTGGSTHVYSGEYTGSGGGIVALASGIVTAANSQNVTLDFDADTFQWSGGRLNTGGAGATFTNVGVINIVDGPVDDATLRVGMVNHATVLQTRSEFPLRFVGSGIVQNQSLWDIQGDGGFQHTADGGSGTREFNNLAGGTLRKSAGTGTSDIDLVFNNQGGTIDVRTGTLSLARGGTSTGGTFLVAPGATLDLTGGSTHVYSGEYTGSGGGIVALASGIVTAANSQNVTLDFDADTFEWSGGRLNTGGGGAAFTNVGVINVVDGSVDDATLRVGLVNQATVIQTRSEFPLRFVGSGIVQNQSLWDIQGDGGFQHTADGGSGTREFINLAGGTLRKSAGTGTSAINLALHNQGGTIEVHTGTLSLALGGTSTGGTYLVSPGATLDLTGGSTHVYTGEYTGSGGGIVSLASGTVTAANSQNVTFDFDADTFQWSGGRLNTGGPGASFTNVGVINIVDGLNDDATLRVGLVNQATVIQTRSEFPLRFVGSGIVQNQSLWDIQGDGGFQHTPDGGSGTREFNNLAGGTLRKSAGMGTSVINLALHNHGAIEVQTGTLALTHNGFTNSGDLFAKTGATLRVTKATVVPEDASVAGGGTFDIPDLAVAGTASPGDSQQATMTVLGNLLFDTGAAYDWEIDGSTGDLIDVQGALTFGETATLNVIQSGESPPLVGDYNLFRFEGDAPDLPEWTLNLPSGWEHNSVVVDGQFVKLSITAVPEPGSISLALAGLITGTSTLRRQSPRRRRSC